MLCIPLIKELSHYLQLSKGTDTRGLVGDYSKISGPAVHLLQPLYDKSPPFPGWGGGGGGGGGGGEWDFALIGA